MGESVGIQDFILAAVVTKVPEVASWLTATVVEVTEFDLVGVEEVRAPRLTEAEFGSMRSR